MMRKPFATALTLAAAALLAAGCSDQGPTAPDSAGLEPSFARATTVTGYNSATDPSLLAWYSAEQARVARQAVLEETTYNTLVSTHGPYASWSNKTARAGVAQCYPNRYAADVQIIGPAGGELKIGTHSFTVPANSLAKYYVITGEDHADTKAAVEFSPEGLGFAKAATVRLDYSRCNIPDGVTKHVVFTDDKWNIKEYEPTQDDVVNKILGGLIVHFSQYAVAW